VIGELEEAIGSLSISLKDEKDAIQRSPVRSLLQPASSNTQDLEVCSSLSKTPKSETHIPTEALKEAEDLPMQPRNQHSLPISRSSSPSSLPKKSKDKSRACTKTNGREPEQEQTQTIGHLENLTTSNGFWTVDSPSQTEDGSTITAAGHSATLNNTQHDQKKPDKKKRVPRVSILDLV
jgi:hypothetical protein